MKTDKKPINSIHAEKALISVNNLCHSFGHDSTKRQVLRDVNVDFYPGEIVIIMGPSGAGKTTLLSLAGALRSIQSGNIIVDGMDLAAAGASLKIEARHKIGFVFQAHNLLESLSACENVQMGLAHISGLSVSEIRKRSISMLEKTGLSGHIFKRPKELSGGQRQRVAIARALVREPAIIMADEPTAALDKQSGREIVDLLQQLAKEMKCAVLMVTHDNRILDIADRVLTLEDGNIEESHRGLERLRVEFCDIMSKIARYPQFFVERNRSNDLCEIFAKETREQLADLRSRAVFLAARRLCVNLIKDAEMLEKRSGLAVLLESTVFAFGEIYVQADFKTDSEKIAPLFESLEFLLQTAAEALSSENPDDIIHLQKLTEDRGPLMEKLRERNFRENTSDTRSFNDHYFDLTNIFARVVYFLNIQAHA